MGRVFLGIVLVVILAPLILFVWLYLGRVPVAVADPPLHQERFLTAVPLRARIARERAITVVGQLTILATVGLLAGWWIAFKVYMVPYFLVFPVAFVLNRLGQHYDIDPSDPAKWSTLMAPSRWWDFVYLWSSYHLEHHYFPSVPFYNLRRLHQELQPFFRERGMTPKTYTHILWDWFVRNRPPHANWDALDRAGDVA